ncbi:MAG: hypothetical protein R3C03_08160 [Pirellulaceae bacterium]
MNTRRRKKDSRLESNRYQPLEARHMLTIMVELIDGDLILDSSQRQTTEVETLRVSDTGEKLVFSLESTLFKGMESDVWHFNNPHEIVVAKSSIADGSVANIRMNLGSHAHMDVLFDNNVDLHDLTGALEIESPVAVRQTGSLLVPELRVAAPIIQLDSLQNDFDTFSYYTFSRIDAETISLGDIDDLTINALSFDGSLNIRSASVHLNDSIKAQSIAFRIQNGVTQSSETQLSANQLLISGSGNVNLNNPENRIFAVGGRLTGDLILSSTRPLTIDRLDETFVGFNGLEVNGSFTLNSMASSFDLTQRDDSRLFVSGTTTLNLPETGSAILVTGDMDGDGLTDNNLGTLTVSNGQRVEVVDSNNLILGAIELGLSLFVRTGAMQPGRLTLLGDIHATNSILLQSSAGIVQSSGTLQTNRLFLGGSTSEQGRGNFTLLGQNVASEISANVLAGSLDLFLANDVVISKSRFEFQDGSILAFPGVRTSQRFAISAGKIADADNTEIIVGGDLLLTSKQDIDLADDNSNTLMVVKKTQIQSLADANIGTAGLVHSGSLSYSLTGNLNFHQFSQVLISGNNHSARLNLDSNGSILMQAGASVVATQTAALKALDRIELATLPTQSINFQDLHLLATNGIDVGGFNNATIFRTHFVSEGEVSISQAGFLNLFDASRSGPLTLNATQTIRDSASATLDVDGNALFHSEVGVSLGDDITNRYLICGTADFDVTSFVLLDPAGDITIRDHQVNVGVFQNIHIDSTDC